MCLAYANVNANGLANCNGNCDGGSHSDSHGDSHGYGYCHCHTNAYGYTDAAGYSYSKTSPNAEASPVALIGTVKAGTRETNSRVPRSAGDRDSWNWLPATVSIGRDADATLSPVGASR